MSPYLDPVGLASTSSPSSGLMTPASNCARSYRRISSTTASCSRPTPGSNSSGRPEQPRSPRQHGHPRWRQGAATMAEFDLGASYRLAPNWSLGLEFRNHNEFEGRSEGPAIRSTPAFFPRSEHPLRRRALVLTLSALRQIGAVAFNDDQKAEMKRRAAVRRKHTNGTASG